MNEIATKLRNFKLEKKKSARESLELKSDNTNAK
jgi:hypothetical protein